MKAKKPQLVHNWKKMWKSTSVQLAAAGSAVTAYLLSDPNAAQELWNAVPIVVQQAVPAKYTPMIGVAITLLSIPARIVKQNKVSGEVKEIEE